MLFDLNSNPGNVGDTITIKCLNSAKTSGILVRKKDKIIVWPVYFDSTKTRAEGRSVPKGLAVSSPGLEEIRKAVERAGLRPEIVLDAAHPSNPLRKTGLVFVPKRGSKTRTLRKIAMELLNIRGKT